MDLYIPYLILYSNQDLNFLLDDNDIRYIYVYIHSLFLFLFHIFSDLLKILFLSPLFYNQFEKEEMSRRQNKNVWFRWSLHYLILKLILCLMIIFLLAFLSFLKIFLLFDYYYYYYLNYFFWKKFLIFHNIYIFVEYFRYCFY